MPDINTDKVCFLIVKAREFDVKTGVEDPDPDNENSEPPAGDDLQDFTDDPTIREIKMFVDDLNEDEQIDLLGAPLLGDFLEEALSQFGQSCKDVELSHL